jgi:serine/threonine protein kinase
MLTVAEVRQRIVEGDLVSARKADDCVRRWLADQNDSDDGDAFVSWLAGEDVLTPFQFSALQAGHAAPFLLGPYRVFDRLAHTEMGHVYRAVHAELELPVSLKVFSSSLEQQPVLLARMQREARASVELDHPNVLRIFQVGRAGNIYFLASQNITGESLADWLVRDGRLPAVPACKVVRQAALGLQHLHEKCMVHRNVCPQNLWLNDSGAVKLVGLDWIRDTDGAFGIADPADSPAKPLVGRL